MKTPSVCIEESRTPIYNRIVQALSAALRERGVKVNQLSVASLTSGDLAATLRKLGDAVYLCTNDNTVIHSPLPGGQGFAWDLFPGRILFLHQDSLSSGLRTFELGLNTLRAYQQLDQRAHHLCIEAANVAQLKRLGVRHASLVAHASEIPATPPSLDAPAHTASFVGHVLPWSDAPPAEPAWMSRTVESMLDARFRDFSSSLHEQAVFAGLNLPESDYTFTIAMQLWLRALANSRSVAFRGRVLAAAALPSMTLVGGDPAYLHRIERNQTLELPGLSHRPAIYERKELEALYRGSAVSLNISSPQFDYAVPNRFHDIFMAGGLCLTDRRQGLRDLTRYHDEVSYGTLAELREKSAYYARPDKRKTRARLITAVQADVAARSGYGLLAAQIIELLHGREPALSSAPSA